MGWNSLRQQRSHPFFEGIPDGAYFYTANSNDTVSVIDTATNTVVTSFSVDPQPETNVHHIAVSLDGTIYVTDYKDKAVRVISVT